MSEETENHSVEQMKFQAGDLYNLPRETINAIQRQYDEHNVKIIEEAFANREISEGERDYLLSYYKEGMEVYRQAYRAIYELYGLPKSTCAFNPKNGKVDVNEKGQSVDYELKVLAPFVNTRLEYSRDDPVYVIFPKMKSVERAIEKLKKEYEPKKRQEMINSLDRFYASEDREGFSDALQKIPETTDSLRDIVRLTITAEYKSEVERLMREIVEKNDPNICIDKNGIRNLFDGPFSYKSYYDIKIPMKVQGGVNVEIQLKINTLYQGDIQTHGYYEKVRSLEAEEEKDPVAAKIIKARIDDLNERISKINKNRIHLYNMKAMDKVRRIEDDGYIPLQIEPDYPNGTYKRCCEFIRNEYMPESTKKFDAETAFSADNEVNKLCFLQMTKKLPEDFNEFSKDAWDTVEMAFEALKPAEKDRFNAINKVANRYQAVIDSVITRHNRALSSGVRASQKSR
ncbi:MAG: hypothetical protein MJ210_00185 [Alphaproteobacteria bacterium]|nr:hypothetical protein [Alphaproteobacteria bacterium]